MAERMDSEPQSELIVDHTQGHMYSLYIVHKGRYHWQIKFPQDLIEVRSLFF